MVSSFRAPPTPWHSASAMQHWRGTELCLTGQGKHQPDSNRTWRPAAAFRVLAKAIFDLDEPGADGAVHVVCASVRRRFRVVRACVVRKALQDRQARWYQRNHSRTLERDTRRLSPSRAFNAAVPRRFSSWSRFCTNTPARPETSPGVSVWSCYSESMEIGGVRLKKGDYIFGFPDEWAKFQERFPDFLKALDGSDDRDASATLGTDCSQVPSTWCSRPHACCRQWRV